jgi:hypothetical protein
MTHVNPRITLKYGHRILEENAEVEWYSGSELHTHPSRIKINGFWKDVVHYDKIVREDTKHQREIVFRCHIGDNRFVEIIIS